MKSASFNVYQKKKSFTVFVKENPLKSVTFSASPEERSSYLTLQTLRDKEEAGTDY